MIRTVSLLSAAFLAFQSLAFAQSDAAAEGPLPQHAETLGRTVTTDDGALSVGWPASGFALSFTGTRATMTAADSGGNVFDLIVNGERRTLAMEEGSNSYVLAEAAAPRDFDIELRRQSESFATGLTTIEAVSVDGETRPVALPQRRILFLGDSITAGYGLQGADETCGYSNDTNAPQLSYAVRTARALDADYHLVAISGRGAVYNYGNDTRPNMLAHLTLALPDTPVYWEKDRWVPDAVVVNLGTNDHSTWDPSHSFAANYTAILYDIAAAYPDAPIIAVTGPMSDEDIRTRIRTGVSEAIGRAEAAGIGPIAHVHTELAESGHIYGCDWHPGPDSTRVMAEAVVPVVAEAAGWSIPGR